MRESRGSPQRETSKLSEAGQRTGGFTSTHWLRAIIATLRVQPWLLYGAYLFCVGTVMYVAGNLLVFPRYLLGLYKILTPVSVWLVWYSGLPMVTGLMYAFIDLVFFFEQKRPL